MQFQLDKRCSTQQIAMSLILSNFTIIFYGYIRAAHFLTIAASVSIEAYPSDRQNRSASSPRNGEVGTDVRWNFATNPLCIRTGKANGNTQERCTARWSVGTWKVPRVRYSRATSRTDRPGDLPLRRWTNVSPVCILERVSPPLDPPGQTTTWLNPTEYPRIVPNSHEVLIQWRADPRIIDQQLNYFFVSHQLYGNTWRTSGSWDAFQNLTLTIPNIFCPCLTFGEQ